MASVCGLRCAPAGTIQTVAFARPLASTIILAVAAAALTFEESPFTHRSSAVTHRHTHLNPLAGEQITASAAAAAAAANDDIA